MPLHNLARNGQFAVAALLGGHIDDDAARFHAIDHFRRNQLRRGLARNQRGRNDDVDFLGLLGVHLALSLLEAFTHHLGVTTTTGTFFFVIHLDKFATERLDLIGHLGTRIVSAHDSAKARSRTQSGQTSHAGTGDKDLSWRNLASSGHLTVEETAKRIGRFDHGAIAADAGHRRQSIHFLRTGELAWQGINGQNRYFSVGQLLHQFRVLCRPDKADQGSAFAQQADFLSRRNTHLENDIGRGPQLSRIFNNFRTNGKVSLVTEMRLSTRVGFNGDLEPQLDQLFNDVGNGRNAFLPREDLPRYSNSQWHAVLHNSFYTAKIGPHRKRLEGHKPCRSEPLKPRKNLARQKSELIIFRIIPDSAKNRVGFASQAAHWEICPLYHVAAPLRSALASSLLLPQAGFRTQVCDLVRH